MFLKKRRQIYVEVIDFNAMHVSTGNIGGYIKRLYREEGLSHIGYRIVNKNGLKRWVIYTLPDQIEVIQYFRDRCPAMVEEECRKTRGEAHEWVVWDNGFEEIKE